MKIKQTLFLFLALGFCMASFRLLWSALPENRYLLRAISEGNLEKATLVYKQSTQSIDELDVDGNGPLHISCQSADTQEEPVILWFLLDNFADARLRNNIQETPAHDVIYIANVDKRIRYINYLIKHGTPLNARDNYHNTVLDKCVIERNLGACQAIMDWFGPLISKDTLENAKKLAGAQAGLGFGFTDIYEELDKKRKIVYDAQGYQEQSGLTQLMCAVINDDKKTIISILDKDTKKLTLNMRSNDRWGYSALELAVMQQNSPLVELLIQRGANTAQKNKLNQYPLMRVFTVRNKTQRLRMAQLLMDKNININERDSNGYTVLHRAVYMNDVALVKAIVEQYGSHINPQMKDQQGRTVLEIADQNKLNDIKKILGAIINNI